MAGKKKKFDFSTMHLSDIPRFVIALFKGQVGPEEPMMSEQTGYYEINLVPDVKAEMIKAQKVRNLVFFACIVVSILSAATAVTLGSIKGAQDITMAGQDSHISELSKKITSYEELPEFLTIQNQLRGISQIEDNQKVLSRAIIFLNSLIPNEGDKVEVSELSVDLATGTLSFDAQADARAIGQPDIDYRVLESFMKRTNMMTFDYGRYVDSVGNEIPSRCIEEYDVNGNMFQENGNIFAIWHRGDKGCDPTRDDYAPNEDGSVTVSDINIDLDSTKMNNGKSDAAQVKTKDTDKTKETDKTKDTDTDNVGDVTDDDLLNTNTSTNTTTTTTNNTTTNNTTNQTTNNTTTSNDATNPEEKVEKRTIDYVPSEKIYRSPQFTAWYASEPWKTIQDGIDDAIPAPPDEGTVYNVTNYKYTPTMELDGSISGIPHFESKCITYTGEDTTEDGAKKKTAKWSADNVCVLVPEGIQITESANGRDAEENLVLTFRAIIKINLDAFAFRNKHVMAIGPNGQNVTDSYVQLEKLFAAPAEKCSDGDSECNSAPTGNGGKEN